MQSNGTLNITRFIDNNRITGYQFRIFILAGLLVMFDGFDSLLAGVTAPSIAATLKLPMSTFGTFFAAGQFGIMTGAIIFGPPADYWGRKKTLLSAACVFGVFSLLTATATSYGEVVTFRFITGVGMGGAAPSLVALVSEYAPKRIRAFITTLFWGIVPAGGIVAGLASSFLMPRYGWQSVYLCGGIIPLVLVVILLVWLPESAAFLVARGAKPARISGIAAAMGAPSARNYEVNDIRLPGVPVQYLFRDRRAVMTILFWITFFLSFLVIVFGVSWLPSLLREKGASVEQTGIALSIWSFAGVIGPIVFGYIIERTGPYAVQIWGYVLLAICVGSLGYATSVWAFAPLLLLIALTAAIASGTNAGIGALMVLSYPTPVRGTASGWGYGFGRAGASVGPLLGGVLLGRHWPSNQIWLAFGAPALLSVVLVLLLKWQITPALAAAAEPAERRV